jgi:hypothetical protein
MQEENGLAVARALVKLVNPQAANFHIVGLEGVVDEILEMKFL